MDNDQIFVVARSALDVTNIYLHSSDCWCEIKELSNYDNQSCRGKTVTVGGELTELRDRKCGFASSSSLLRRHDGPRTRIVR